MRTIVEDLIDGGTTFNQLPAFLQNQIRREPGTLQRVLTLTENRRARDLAAQSGGVLEATGVGRRLRPTTRARGAAQAEISGREAVPRTTEERADAVTAREARREAAAPARARGQARAIEAREVRLAGGVGALRKRRRKEEVQDRLLDIQQIAAIAGGGRRGGGGGGVRVDAGDMLKGLVDAGVPAEELPGRLAELLRVAGAQSGGITGGQPPTGRSPEEIAAEKSALDIPEGPEGTKLLIDANLLLGNFSGQIQGLKIVGPSATGVQDALVRAFRPEFEAMIARLKKFPKAMQRRMVIRILTEIQQASIGGFFSTGDGERLRKDVEKGLLQVLSGDGNTAAKRQRSRSGGPAKPVQPPPIVNRPQQ